MPRIIQRYIRNEIVPPFLLSLFVFTLVLFMQNILDLSDMILTRGVRLSSFFYIVLYTLPSLLWFSIPMAFLMATLIGLGRLSSDNEIIAMHSLGIGKSAFVRPVLGMGAVLFLLCFAIGAVGVPWGRSSLNMLVYRIFKESATAGIQPRTFNDRFSDLVIYADKVSRKKNTLQRVIIADYRGELPETIVARSGTIRTDPKTPANTLSLMNGSVHQFDPKNGRYRQIHFDQYSLSLSTDAGPALYSMNMLERNPAEMTLSELKKAAGMEQTERARRFHIHYQEKFALPFSCIVFGLFSIPFGIRIRKSGKFSGFSWSLLVFFLYYILLGTGRNLGSKGMIPAALAAWLPNIVFGLTGAALLLQASRRVPGGGRRSGKAPPDPPKDPESTSETTDDIAGSKGSTASRGDAA